MKITDKYHNFKESQTYFKLSPLVKNREAELLGPAVVLATAIDEQLQVSEVRQLSVLWIQPSGFELFDDSKWLGAASNILGHSFSTHIDFLTPRRVGSVAAHDAESIVGLGEVTADYLTYSDPLEKDYDLILWLHPDTLTSQAKQVSALIKDLDKPVYATFWSEADLFTESVMLATLGLEVGECVPNILSSKSSTEFGSGNAAWLGPVKAVEDPVPTHEWAFIVDWNRRQSIDMDMVNPLWQPISKTEGFKLFAASETEEAIYLIDDLYLLPATKQLVRYSLNERVGTVVGYLNGEDYEAMPMETATFTERFEWVVRVKFTYIPLKFSEHEAQNEFIQACHDFVDGKRKSDLVAHQLGAFQTKDPVQALAILNLVENKTVETALQKGILASFLNSQGVATDIVPEDEFTFAMQEGDSATAWLNMAYSVQRVNTEPFNSTVMMCLRESARLGMPSAHFELGCHAQQEGDENSAMYHWGFAARYGHKDSKDNMHELMRIMEETGKISAKARKRFERLHRQMRGV